MNAALQKAIEEVSGDGRESIQTDHRRSRRPAGHLCRSHANALRDTWCEAADYLFNKEAHVARFLHGLLPAPGDDAAAAAFPDNVNAVLLRVRPEMDYAKALQLLDPMALANGKGREGGSVTTRDGPRVSTVFLRIRDVPRHAGRAHLVESRARPRSSSRLARAACFKRKTSKNSPSTSCANEVTTTNQDELATAIKDENQKGPKLGSSTHRWSNHLDCARRSQRYCERRGDPETREG